MQQTFDPGRPIYTQIVEYLRQQIACGAYAAGARLPSVRELAAAAGVNPNTMQRALAELERQGLVCTERTAGRYVTTDSAFIAAVRHDLALREAESFLARMAQLGYSRAEAAALLDTQ